jgi:hypothetical protein
MTQENKLLTEARAFNNSGELLNNSFGYFNKESGKFEKRGLKEYLTDLGIYLETHEETSQELRDYYRKLKQMINKM